MDFVIPAVRTNKNGTVEIYPRFKVGDSEDLMIRGGDFYAVWNEQKKRWATDQNTVIKLIDAELDEKANSYIASMNNEGNKISKIVVKYMHDSESGSIDRWHHYVQKQMRDNWVSLNGKLIFSNTEVKREDYSSHRLNYPLQEGSYESYDKLISVLYSPEERMKIEWAIGAVIAGDSPKIQKFIVFTGDAGTGKSTVLKIIRMLFKGYTATINAKAIGSPNASFALEALKKDPLVAIEDEADLSSLKDNTRLNSLVSHDYMSVNEKFKSPYEHAYRCFIFLCSNEDVNITDSRSGMQRRLIDVRPTGMTVPIDQYDELMEKIPFELSGIAYHCLQVYKNNKHAYDKYRPTQSMRNTNIFYNFMEENYMAYMNGVNLELAWKSYKTFCEENEIRFPMNKYEVKKELYSYFRKFINDGHTADGRHVRQFYEGLRLDKFGIIPSEVEVEGDIDWLTEESLKDQESQLNLLYPNTPAQLATKEGGPRCSWDNCRTRLCDVDPRELHWFKLPEDVIKIDFDLKDAEGNKSLELNLKAANKFPKTYAEVSKSGCGIHLYYIYDGDPNELSRIYDENIEVKVSTGNNSHRRILTRCNNIPVNHISTGLPLKEKKPVVENVPITVTGLRTTIKRCLAKEIHADTRSNVDWIYEVLERAYESGLIYDLSDMKDEVEDFCSKSTHQSEYCKKKFGFMKFKSKSIEKVSLKGGKLLIDGKAVEDESAVRYYVQKILDQPPCPERVAELFDIFNKAYDAGLIYDLSDVKQSILIYTIEATKDQNDKLVAKIAEMKIASIEEGQYDDGYNPDDPIIFFDFEVKPNMNLLCWKYRGKENKVMKVFNPTPQYIAEFFGLDGNSKKKIIGFNNKEYDNHIAYAIWLGKTPYEVFLISKAIINEKNSKAKYREAKKLSYSDILDFMPEKIGLKKWEIRLKIPHQEFNRPWDEPIDESEWPALASYCENDVLATEAVFECKEGQAAWKARNILVELNNALVGPGSNLNDSTNNLTTRLIVGDEKDPQKYFVYPDLSEEFPGYEYDQNGIDPERYISKDVIISGKSIYRGYDPGEGGFVYAEEGMYGLSESDDSASHHPSTIRAKNGFGKFTQNFNRLLDLRLMIKHKEYDKIREQYPVLSKYLNSDRDAKDLSYALKIAINSVYGLTAAKFPNKLRDPRNKDNWVAKRGALFMIDLMLNVKERGYKVLHCKTDSIKVLNPDDNIRNYIYEYGKKFGYTFEVEHRFDRICLVNDAVYVCKYTDEEVNEDMAGKWDATGKQFQVPYVFKTLFSHEPIEFDDMCETKNTSTAFYLDMNENLPEGEHDYVFIGKTGKFTPIKAGCGGGILYRDDGKGGYASAESSKGFRWLESDTVLALHKEDDIDRSYYTKLVDKAVEKISKYGDLEAFTAEGTYVDMSFMNIPETDDEEVPFL